MKYTLLSWMLMVMVAACTPAATPVPSPTPTAALPAPSTPTPTPAAVSTPTRPAGQEINLDLLNNFTYELESTSGLQVTLIDGSFNTKDSGNLVVASGQLVKAALGDLNGDGIQDAAVTVAVNTGGSGTFHELIVVLSRDGKAAQAAHLFLEDRLAEKGLTITGGLITLEMVRHGPNDPFCCPTENAVTVYRYQSGELVVVSDWILSSTSTALTNSYPNYITIDSPINGAVVSGSLLLRGKTSQMPFEKNLVVRVLNASSSLVLEQPLAVQGEYGGPGSFEIQLRLPADLKGTVRLDVVDIDMAGGRPRGLASVAFNIQ